MNLAFNFHDIYWRESLWLFLSFQPFILLLLKNIVRKNNLSLYAEKQLQAWVVFPTYQAFKSIIINKNTVYLCGWILFSIAMAGPRTPLTQVDKEQFFGANIMLVVDLSRSMNATDIIPSRLRRAKIEIYELLEKASDHRIGITVFSARPHLFVPITSDHAALVTYLESLDKLSFPTLGTDPVAAIELAQQELIKAKGKSVIILLTDGDFPVIKGNQLTALKRANIPLYILGVGTVEGEAVQLDNGTWLKHKQQDVVSRMNEDNLQHLATYLNGKYSPVYDDDTDWHTIYNQGITQHNSIKNIKNEQRIIWRELFPFFLIPSLMLFIFSLSLYKFKPIKNIVLFALASILIFSIPEKEANAIEFGQTIEQSAFRAYTKENYSQADKLYQNISGYRSYLGQGNSLYKMGHYTKAIKQFVFASLSANNDAQRANALYNLANSYFRTGNFITAIATYQDVLRYQPDNKACLYNLKTSRILRENIEQRLKEKEKIISSSRQGRGPHSASVADGTDISDNTTVSSGDSKNKLNDKIPLPDIPDLNEEKIRKLILSGLKNIKFASQGNISNNRIQSTAHENIDLLKVQQQAMAIQDSHYLLWKRLFEIEEGFPAPVQTPRTLLNVKPW